MLEKYVGQLVEIVYMDRKGKLSQRHIEVYRVRNGLIRATCLQTGQPRVFRLDQVLAWQPTTRTAQEAFTMGKKLEDNGFWESSRFIIPEHKKLMRDRQRRGKPELDDQEVQLIEQALIDSQNTRQPVTVTVFSPFDDEVMSGCSYINKHRQPQSKAVSWGRRLQLD